MISATALPPQRLYQEPGFFEVPTSGFTNALTRPLFDHNRGNIAIETAICQRLRDDYAARLLTTLSDVQKSAILPRFHREFRILCSGYIIF